MYALISTYVTDEFYVPLKKIIYVITTMQQVFTKDDDIVNETRLPLYY